MHMISGRESGVFPSPGTLKIIANIMQSWYDKGDMKKERGYFMKQTKWKKRTILGTLPVFLIFVMLASLLTGCGGTDPKALTESATTNLMNIRAMSGTISLDMGMSVSGQTQGTSVSGDFTMFLDSGEMHMNMNASADGESQQAEVYVVEENGQLVSYVNEGDGFKKGTVDNDYLENFNTETIKKAFQDPDFQKIVGALEDSCAYENRGAQNINGRSCTQVHCEMDLPAFMEALANSGALDSSGDREQITAAISMMKGMLEDVKVPYDYYISEEDGMLRRASMDVKDSLNTVMGKVGALVAGDQTPNFTAASLQVDLTAVNDEVAEIVVPADISSSAGTSSSSSQASASSAASLGVGSIDGTVWKVTEVENEGIRVNVDEYIKTQGKSGEMVFEFRDGKVEALVGSEVVGAATDYTYENGTVTIDGVSSKIENDRMTFNAGSITYYLELKKGSAVLSGI